METAKIRFMTRKNNHETFVKEEALTHFGLESGHEEKSNIILIAYKSDGLLKKNTKSYLVDSIAFISNIGGGLGLALGISIFSVLDYITVRLFDKIIAAKNTSTYIREQSNNKATKPKHIDVSIYN